MKKQTYHILLLLAVVILGAASACNQNDIFEALSRTESGDQVFSAAMLLAHWKFDNDVLDSSGNGITGTPYNAAYERGVVGTRALRGNGTNCYVDFGASLCPTLTTDRDWSLSFWARTDVTETSFIECVGSFTVSLDASGRVRLSKAYGDWTGVRGNTTIAPYRWAHIALVHHRNNTVNIFINGAAETITTNLTALSTGSSVWVGRTSIPGYLNGAIDDVRVFSGILGTGDIQNLAALGPVSWWRLDESAGPPQDAMIAQNNGTVYGATQNTIGGQFNGYASFNAASNQYIALPNAGNVISQSSPWTFAFWMRVTDLGIDHHFIGNSVPWTIRYNYYTPILNRLYFFAGSSYSSFVTNPGFTANTWAHIAVTGSGATDTLVFYIDGVPFALAGGNFGGYATSSDIWLGRFGSFYFTGDLDDVRVYRRILSQTEIDEIRQ
ncbi:MAG TPA: LamG domain-containing protein [Spirochaetota bacterium]|nr:LamG domain-containing protein [Spirochaetota bacterium]HNT09561.1 LamG domain-containing protein [Spirochaetota bacterium]HOS40141.1 LamG domain-containing protein [Spirochaetota bacterium]